MSSRSSDAEMASSNDEVSINKGAPKDENSLYGEEITNGVFMNGTSRCSANREDAAVKETTRSGFYDDEANGTFRTRVR